MSGTAPTGRVQDIARQIRGAALPFLGTDSVRKDAAEASQVATTQHTSNRESIMGELAKLSQAGQWSASEVKGAAKVAADLSAKIETEKSLATFIGECKRAMHPKVRAYVDDMIAVRDLAWEAEKLAYAEDKDSPTPLRKAFSRGYHCLIAMFGEAEENARVIETVPDLLAFAAEKDPDLDIGKVKKRLDKIRDQLSAFYQDWPVEDLQSCVDVLNEIDTKALRKARPETTKPIATKPQTTGAPAGGLNDAPSHTFENEEIEETDETEDRDEPVSEEEAPVPEDEGDIFDQVLGDIPAARMELAHA